MVFYGKKRSQTQDNYEQYHSIRDQILKQIGQRITPIYQKSLATIFADAGHVILTATQSILDFPEYFRTTQIFKAYQIDKAEFNKQMQSDVIWYQSLPKIITQNKLFLLNNFSCDQRIFALNAFVAFLGVFSLSFKKGYSNKIRVLMKNCVLGYAFGGLFLVPEIYNTIWSSKIF